jgi:hypothetical protein
MIEAWRRSVEKIAHHAVVRGVNVLGFTSIDGDAGVSTVSRMICEVLSRSTIAAMLVDLTSPVHDDVGWRDITVTDIAWQRVPADRPGYSAMLARPTTGTRYLFNNVSLLQQLWKNELASHAMLVLDLPPVIQHRSDLLNPLAAAASCDAICMVCLQGRTSRSRLSEAVATLRTARVNLTHLVINQRNHETPGEQIARNARKWSGVAPRLAARIESAVLNSEYLR